MARPLTPSAFIAELFEELREEGWVTINGEHVLIGADGQVDSAGMAAGGSKDAGKAGDSLSPGSSAKVAAMPRATVGDFLDPEALDHEIAPIASEQAGSIEMLLHAGGDRNMNSAIAIFKGTPEATAFLMSDGGSTNEARTAAFLTAHTDHSFAVDPNGGLSATAKSRESLREAARATRKIPAARPGFLKREKALSTRLVAAIDAMHAKMLDKARLVNLIESAVELREAKKPPKPAKPADVAAVVDSAAFAYELEDALAEEMTIGYGEAIGELGLGLGFDVLPKDALKYLSTHIDEFAASVAQGEREGVLTFIRSALTDGVGAHELGAQLKDYFAEGVHRVGADGTTQFVEDTASWSDTVARTELSRAYNDGKRELYASAGYSKWQFVAAEDELMCGECEGLDGEVVEIGEPFSSGDDAPPIHPNCVVAGTRIATDDATVGLCRWFEGSIIRIVTKLGHELTGTPDHPIATRRGWVALGAIHKGDEILSSTRAEWALASNPDDGEMPPVIENITEALAMVFRGMPISTENLDGNVIDRKVDVVNPDRLLSGNDDAILAKHRLQQHFRRRFIPLSDLDGLRPSLSLTNGGFATAGSVIRRLGDLVLLLRSSFGLLDLRRREVTANQRVIVDKNASNYRAADLEVNRERILRFSSTVTAKQIDFVDDVPTIGTIDTTRRAMIANGNSRGHESPEYGIDADAQGFCDKLLRGAIDIALDEVCFVEINPFAGHVYNLTTKSGWYVANGIVTHNCRCTTVSDPDAMDTINADRADAGDAGDAGDETVMESIGRRLREDWVTINGEHVLIGGDGKVDSAGMASYGGGKGSTRQAVSIAMRALTKTGGFTVSIHGVVPTHGYMIAGEIDEEQHALAGTRASLRDAITTFATKHNALLGNNERYIGGWAEKHAVFLDVSQRLAVSRSAALQTAREQDQIAVWHLDKKETVYTMSDHLHPSESKGHILESVRPVESDDGAENDGVAFMIAPGENIDDAAKKIADAWAEKFDMP